jgi:hypothetical protein
MNPLTDVQSKGWRRAAWVVAEMEKPLTPHLIIPQEGRGEKLAM